MARSSGSRVAGSAPSGDVLGLAPTTRSVDVVVEWEAAQPVDRIEIVRDGEVVAVHANADLDLAGRLAVTIDVAEAGWLAARCWGRRRTSYGHPLWAHTSPVYLRELPGQSVVSAAASAFEEHIDRAREWIATRGRFDEAAQRDRLLQIYAEGRDVYARLRRA